MPNLVQYEIKERTIGGIYLTAIQRNMVEATTTHRAGKKLTPTRNLDLMR